MKPFARYLRHLEKMRPIFEELQDLSSREIARVLMDRRIENFQGKVKWSVVRVDYIREQLAPIKECEDILEFRLPTVSAVLVDRIAAKKRRFEDDP